MMELIDIQKQIKTLEKQKARIEKLMRKPDGKILEVAWLNTISELNELQGLIDNCEFTITE